MQCKRTPFDGSIARGTVSAYSRIGMHLAVTRTLMSENECGEKKKRWTLNVVCSRKNGTTKYFFTNIGQKAVCLNMPRKYCGF